ncbi:hypothetical protein E4631_04905 [Hymenobacter sp. UV11]|uniref:hypothetical protein n=1 Tax=Hymenobacter sp. UV11 TaxID=1849735 RepID=UPI00105CB378|nr:hypothetical protein [Hymenobacter sp. UV11]TDN37293.1 hypothetical protein A8B98_04680 [Hymenobacter sp. UV11]TFZ68331.1 hypothetical protein E4631_04905 [Hymenobacter sp. UV11]
MQTLTKLLLCLASLALATACKKEIETITVPVDKAYSWAEVKYLVNYQRNVMRMVPGVNTLNLQETGSFEVLSPIPGSAEQAANGYYTGFGHKVSRTWSSDPLPWDIRNTVPMNANFYANPSGYRSVESDTVLTIYPTKFLDIGTRLHLRGLDPTATQFENFLIGSRFPLGAINRNNYLLCGYHTTNTQEHAFHLVLTKLVNTATTGITAYGISLTGSTQLSSQLIRIPTPDQSQFSFKSYWAVDDYFLVWCDGYGLFKINQDGTYQQVNGTFAQATGPVGPTAVYKWKGTLYVLQSGGTIWTSTNDCASWQRIDGFNPALNFSTFYPVGDSLVGITHGVITNSIYTLRWLNANSIRLRELKNDGLGYVDFSDLAQLGDTVYIGTTNGLFKRPLSKFFESKQ